MNREEIANPTLMEIAETTLTLESTLAKMNDFQGQHFPGILKAYFSSQNCKISSKIYYIQATLELV